MNKEKYLDILKRVASTVNHDVDGKFIKDKSERIELIDSLLKDTDYQLKEIGLCRLYSKKSVKDIKEPVTIISSHIDTHRDITKPFAKIINEDTILGTFDNSVTNAAILSLMIAGKLPDNVVVAFTGNEEYGMKGAKDLGEYLSNENIKANVIVTDVTFNGYDLNNEISIENCCHTDKWTGRIKDLLHNDLFKWRLEGNFEDDETYMYSRFGFETFSFCIPTDGEMHDNDGLRVRTDSYFQYIEALSRIAYL